MVSSQPLAPRHPREDLHQFVDGLNVRYGIGIPIPDPALSPSKRREQGSISTRLYTRLEVHFYHGGVEALHNLTKAYDREVKELWSRWVKKPEGDPDTLPRTGGAPLAANGTERERLQSLFHQVLDRFQPTRSFGRTQSGPAAYSMEKTIYHPKRAADVDMAKTSTKRSRPVAPSASTVLSGAHDIFVVPKPALGSGRSRPSSARAAEPFNKSFSPMKSAITVGSSVDTSKTSFQSVFSYQQPGTASTQGTVEASTQDRRRWPGRSFQDTYEPAPSRKETLPLPFDDYGTSISNPGMKSAGPRDTQSRPTQRSNHSSPMSSAIDLHDSVMGSQSELAGQGQYHRPLKAEPPQQGLQSQLHCMWPETPTWLESAPFPVIWEVNRIAQFCAVDLRCISLAYSSSWTDQRKLRSALWKHEAFRGNAFPASVSNKAWEASLDPTMLLFDQHVLFSASVEFTNTKADPLRLTLQPLRIEQSHRLGRRFGSDRFMELLIPSPDNFNLPQYLMNNDEPIFEQLIQWLTREPHAFCGRWWRPFYTKDGGSREPVKDLSFGPDKMKIYQNRVYFFAEHGTGLPSLRLHSMLKWLLDFRQAGNRRQPVLKLFQRIAIALSTTSPTVVFEPSQMRHRSTDLTSPVGNVMNDGVGRMSRAVARQIRDRLGLRTCPSAVQGRLGSAKGMWVIDVTDVSDEIWIETYPSQRKWDLDWATVDKEQRTLEVLNVPSKPRSARLNLQFLPVIEDRAVNKKSMRKAVGYMLQSSLQNELNSQKEALERPIQFRQWILENSFHRNDRALLGYVAYQGGLPQEDEEIINCMLDAGFEPKANKFLTDLTFATQRRKCETLKKKLNITVGRSANLYMIVDFLGVLEENEVHLGFSTAFEADDDWNKTMLQGAAVVARSPAHFISDIQKVNVVFKPELADLTDVVVFSSKGDVPLADKLSGGDYDGDLAWVCWEPSIVGNFENAEVQEQPDLSRYLRKDKIQFRQLLKSHEGDLAATVAEMMEKSLAFNLTKSMLGSCTNYKESVCYSRGNVGDDVGRILSTLLSSLVDQAKQGIEFTDEDLRNLKKDLANDHGVRQDYNRPAYKSEHWSSDKVPTHIIDYLKFGIAQPIIARELSSFNQALNGSRPEFYDQDLVSYYKKYEQLAKDPSELGKWVRGLFSYLDQEIDNISEAWDRLTVSYTEKVQRTYELWQAVHPDKAPSFPGQAITASAAAMEALLLGGELSHWELWKASIAFYKFKKKRFPWQMACRQLCHIKAQAVCSTPGAALAPAAVVPGMYAGLRPDSTFIKLRVARMEGQGSQFMEQRDEVEDAHGGDG